MPLTDEIKALLGDKATEETLIEMLAPEATRHLESKGHIIRTKDQDESYISSKVEEFIKPRIAELHKKYDDDFFEVLGERKSPNQKTYDFAKEKLAELKSLRATAGKGDQVLQDKIKQLETTISTIKSTHEGEISALKEASFKTSLNAQISSVLDAVTIAIPAHLTTDTEKAAFIASQKQMLKADFLQNFTAKEDENGNLVFYKGESLQSSTKDGKPLSASDLISENYKHYFAKDVRTQGGAGSGQGGDHVNGFKTTQEVYNYLKEQGIDEESKEYSDKALELIRKHGIV